MFLAGGADGGGTGVDVITGGESTIVAAAIGPVVGVVVVNADSTSAARTNVAWALVNSLAAPGALAGRRRFQAGASERAMSNCGVGGRGGTNAAVWTTVVRTQSITIRNGS